MKALFKREKKISLIIRNVVFIMTTILIIIFVTCLYSSWSCQKANLIEKSTGEVYILKDEVVETGYIYSEKNSFSQVTVQ